MKAYQAIHDLLYSLSKSIKGRFGYQITIKQAILLAYFGFLLGVFSALTLLVKGVYAFMTLKFPSVGAAFVSFLPSASIVTGGTTLYLGILTFKKSTKYVHDAWQAWIRTSSY